MTLFAYIGAWALVLMYVWLLGAILGSYISGRKGYGEKPGLATGLILSILAPVIWLFVPAKPDSKWKVIGPLGRGEKRSAQP